MSDTPTREELMGALAERTGEEIREEEDRLKSIDMRLANLNQRCDQLQHAIEIVAAVKPRADRPSSGRRLRNLGATAGLGSFAAGCWWLSPQWSLIVVGGLVFVAAVCGMILSQRKARNV